MFIVSIHFICYHFESFWRFEEAFGNRSKGLAREGSCHATYFKVHVTRIFGGITVLQTVMRPEEPIDITVVLLVNVIFLRFHALEDGFVNWVHNIIDF